MILLTVLSRMVLFCIIWWIITDGALASWWIGVPAVLLALITSIMLVPQTQLVWYELLRFLPMFLIRSLVGGVDVARRAFHPAMPISPELITYPLRLPPGLPQVFMANTVSLLPGTLSAELGANSLRVHVLDGQQDFLLELESVEKNVARMFGVSLKVTEIGE